MAKNSVSDWSATADENTDIAGIDINENCAPGNMNDMGRNIMSQIAALNIGDFGGLTVTITELNYSVGVTSSIQTQLNNLSAGKQPLDGTLTALAGLSTGVSKIPYSTGTDVFDQLNFLDEDDMSSDDPLGVPSQQSVKAYADALVGIGVNQTWQDVSASRSANTSYQNTTGKPIQVVVEGSSSGLLQVSSDNATWITIVGLGAPGSFATAGSPIVPNNHYYRTTGGFANWTELR